MGVLLGTRAEYGPIGCPGSKEVNSNLGCMNRAEPGDPGKGIFSSTQNLLDHRHSAQSGALHYKEDTGKLERVQWRPPRPCGLEHLSYEERLGQLDLFSLEQRQFWGEPTAASSDQGEVIEEP